MSARFERYIGLKAAKLSAINCAYRRRLALIVTAKVTPAVAKKILTNALKGNNPFKPEHGEHGSCSWFYLSGNPYTGVSTTKNIDVVVAVDDTKVRAFDENLIELRAGLLAGALRRETRAASSGSLRSSASRIRRCSATDISYDEIG